MDVMVVGEDRLSAELMKRLLIDVAGSASIYGTHVCRGVTDVRSKMDRFRNASKSIPHAILVDLDSIPCPVGMLASWGLSRKRKNLLFRVAVREVEAWILADPDTLAAFLRVPPAKIPANPEAIRDPKRALINIARRSHSKQLASEMAPGDGSMASIGPLYNERLAEYVQNQWRPAVARANSQSLDRALKSAAEFLKG